MPSGGLRGLPGVSCVAEGQAKLVRRRGTGEAIRSLVDPARQSERAFLRGERISSVDENRWRSHEAQPIRILGRFDPFESDFNIGQSEFFEHAREPLVGRAPVGTPVEVAEPNVHPHFGWYSKARRMGLSAAVRPIIHGCPTRRCPFIGQAGPGRHGPSEAFASVTPAVRHRGVTAGR